MVLALLAFAALGGAAWGHSAHPVRDPIGGRPAALGHAYSALAGDAYAPVWNPAALAVLPVAQASLMHAGGSDAAARQSATLALPLGRASGAGFAADLADGQAMYGLAYGRRFGAAALGAAGRYLDGDGGSGRPHAWAADLAGLYRLDERLTAAFVAANLGGRPATLQEPGYRRPEARLGAGYVASRRLTYSLEAVYSRQDGPGVRSGLELRALGWLAARIGVDSTDSAGVGLTTGVGLSWSGQSLDVAYLPRGKDSLEQLSLILRFGRLPDLPADEAAAAPAPPAARPARLTSRPLTFHLEPASAAAAPPPAAAEPAAAPAPAASPALAPRSAPPSREKVDLQEPVPPSMIWFQ